MTKLKEKNHAKIQATAQLKSIISLVKALEKAQKRNNDNATETAITAINEDPLSISIRDDWKQPGDKGETLEFQILLCTGGPAVRILGTLDDNNYPHRAHIEYQDWGIPWTPLNTSPEQDEYILTYSSQFYYGK